MCSLSRHGAWCCDLGCLLVAEVEQQGTGSDETASHTASPLSPQLQLVLWVQSHTDLPFCLSYTAAH